MHALRSLFFPADAPVAAPADRFEEPPEAEEPEEPRLRPVEWVRSILEATSDAICVTDAEQMLTDHNERFLAMWRISGEALVRRDPAEIREHVRRLLAEPEVFFRRLGEIRSAGERETFDVFELRDGRVIERRSSPHVVAGRAVGRVWSFQDITAHRRAEAAARDREDRLRAILSQASVGIAVSGLDGRFQEVNRRFEEIVGYSAAELRERTFADITYPPDRGEALAVAHGLMGDEAGERAFEKRFLRPDGRVVWSRSTVTLIRDDKGAPRLFLGVVEDITGRKEAEDAMRRNDAELRALADSMAQLAWMAEPDGYIFWYNRRWFEYTGTSFEEMRGWGWQSVHDPELLSQVMARWKAAVRAGSPFEMEFPLRGADGLFRWFLTRVMPVRDDAGRVVRWLGTSTDIHRAKRAENALREETRVLELLNRTGAAIAAELDLSHLLQTVVDAGTELSGARFGAFFYAEQAKGGDGRDGFVLHASAGAPPEGLGNVCEGRDRFLSGIFRGGAPVRRDDAPDDVAAAGFPPSRSYLAIPVTSRAGEVLGGLFFGHPNPEMFDVRAERVLVGVAAQAAIAIDNARLYEAAQREIGERARTEQRLRESEARLRASLQTAALGTWELDIATGTVAMDERAQELLERVACPRITLDEFFALTAPEDMEARREAIVRLCGGLAERLEVEFRVASSGLWLKSSAKPVRDGAGAVVRVVGGVLDITDLVRARATTEERRRELERLVEERTASLHQAIAQMEEFSYSVSHDLRAPLRAIEGYAQAVLEDWGGQASESARSHLRRILNAAERMDRLTRDVLTYSRVARGAAPLAVLCLDRLVADTIEQYAQSNRRGGRIEVASPLLSVLGNEPLLVQAISNLVANALKFVEEGATPRVKIWTERRGADVRLWVEDNGIGIRPEHQARIWAPSLWIVSGSPVSARRMKWWIAPSPTCRGP